MVPHVLRIKNFLSYGSDFQTITFKPYHLMYLSGRNGHGKSALLDAMTWALWGIARKSSGTGRADQGLLRLGQIHMSVSFDFEVGGVCYRVKRELVKSHDKATTHLDFGILDVQTEIFKPLTDKSIRITQQKIIDTIKLDYDSFVNTAFLRQGNANEFSKKSPKERKEILGTILGLWQFDVLKKRALEKIKELTIQLNSLRTLQESLNTQLSCTDQVQKDLASCVASLQSLQEREKQLQKITTQLRARRQKLLEQNKEYEILMFKMKQVNLQWEEHKQEFRHLVTTWRLVAKKQREIVSYDALEKKHKTHKDLMNLHDEKKQKRLTVQEELIQLKQQVQDVEQRFKQEQAIAMQELVARKERLRYDNEHIAQQVKHTEMELIRLQEKHTNVQAHLERLRSKRWPEDNIQDAQRQFDRAKEYYHQFVAQRTMLAAGLEQIKQKQEIVHAQDPSCPLCEQSLSVARKKFLRTKYQLDASLMHHQYERLVRLLPRLKEQLLKKHALLEEQRALTHEYEKVANECHEIELCIKTHQEKNQELTKSFVTAQHVRNDVQREYDELAKKYDTVLAGDATYASLTQTILAREQEIAQLAYDPLVHEQVRHEYMMSEQEMASFFSLQKEVHQQQERYTHIEKLIAHIRSHKKEYELLEIQAQPFATMADNQRDLVNDELTHQEAIDMNKREGELLAEQYGALKNSMEHMQRLEEEYKKYTSEIVLLDQEVQDYQLIAQAAGKDGIQALLIEEAIPEIEQEANNLLAKLTHNQSHIIIDSLRDLKNGGTKETLDIMISDPVGIRSYEMFSGGEAFRIDFALRIAISKLLARRAGTSLQTLIIDEGFGSQDEEGLSLIMDALYRVQDDFDKIIVVSHLPSMKDYFPVHFMVDKGPNGSKISIVEQG